ncbi:nucleotidyltransferase domain-containing protein [uncultured Salinicola sp.]|uniref:DNA polymerase beta superfamily protein n=1 Tax=uncultured Salinicola sp. TaxID=1193542 RepID=UPI0026109FC1|nr:nucleotidyltransferase domain-containing protein [uncultured Salinicola sp.]
MKPLRKLVTTVHGSHLYGTSTPSSDEDYKGVHLPSGRGILLQRPENVFDESIKAKNAAGKNTGDAVDHQSYSVEKFCRMLALGDGVATEILFAPDDCIVEAAPEWETLRAEARTLLNADCKGFVGYCKQQAAKYGVKGSRMEAVEKLVVLLAEAKEKHGPKTRLEVIEDDLRAFTERVEMANMIVLSSGHTPDMLHIECCDRKVSMRNDLEEASKIYGAVWKNYGDRARKAKDSNGVDWKAVSHAVRVARQAHELMLTGSITFPRPDAEELLAIKLGKFAYPEIQPLLEGLVDELDRIDSVLPPKPEDEEIEKMISEIVLPRHLSQIAA